MRITDEIHRLHVHVHVHTYYTSCHVMFCSHDFNILLHGVGSKIELLDAFCRQQIKDFNHLVVNGFFPSLTIKSVSDVTRIRSVFVHVLSICVSLHRLVLFINI